MIKQPCLVLAESGEAPENDIWKEAYYLGIYYHTQFYENTPANRTALLVAMKDTGEVHAYSVDSVKFVGDGFELQEG